MRVRVGNSYQRNRIRSHFREQEAQKRGGRHVIVEQVQRLWSSSPMAKLATTLANERQEESHAFYARN